MISQLKPIDSEFHRLERLSPLGYFAMGIGWIRVTTEQGNCVKMLAIANGSDWTPQPVTLHASHSERGFEKLPCWFSADYDHHMGLAVGDVTGNGYDDVVVAVFAGKDQNLTGGGVKIYRGGPEGLDPVPEWLSRGYAATGVALADITGDGSLDILVSCLSEEGSIQAPQTSSCGHFEGRARLLINQSDLDGSEPWFQEHIIERDEARGAGDVTVADVDLDGTLDIVFAGRRTAVLYGDPHLANGRAWEDAPAWISEEEHPFSFTAQAFFHPAFAQSLLIASSRGLFSAEQLAGRSLAEIKAGVFIHQPQRQARTPALQHLALLDEKRPEIPSGLTVTHDPEGYPCIISGFLDARGRDIRGAALRMFRSGQLRQSLPFDDPQGTALPGGGLMAGRVVATPRADGPNSVSDCCLEVGPHPQRVLTLPWRPSGDLLAIRVTDRDGKQVDSRFSRASGGSALCFSPPLPAQSRVTVFVRTAEEVEIAATSSAAWPPAGASGVWRGRLARQQAAFLQSSPPAHVRQAG